MSPTRTSHTFWTKAGDSINLPVWQSFASREGADWQAVIQALAGS